LAEAVTTLDVGIEGTITPVDRKSPLNQTNVLPRDSCEDGAEAFTVA